MKILRKKAMALPKTPGVYIMKNSKGEIIYIGKAKALKNRVSQYFGSQNNHPVKVRKMVENVDDFDVILTDSEFECLVLECSLIKQHSPKYNILLKDDKGYSYIKITKGEYPSVSFTYRQDDDNAEYLGPYLNSFSAKQSIDAAKKIFFLPQCNKVFPRDISRKNRPCLNYHINQCMGVCSGRVSKEEYLEAFNGAVDFLKGGGKDVIEKLTEQMEEASANLEFEKAAKIRDRINAVKRLKQKQKVYSNVIEQQDVFAFAKDNKNVCLMVLRFKDSRLYDSSDYILENDGTEPETLRREAVLRYYQSGRVDVPKRITLDGEVEDRELLEQYLTSLRGKKCEITVPQRSEQLAIVKLCHENAAERLAQYSGKVGRDIQALEELGSILGLNKTPEYIESYDISHTAGSDTVGGMVVFKDGRPYKKGYRKFIVKGFTNDDCASMSEVLTRRFNEYEKAKDTPEGFGILPDLILLDGGEGQVNAVKSVLGDFGLDIPLFGMVKDSKHRTRAIAFDGGEIEINSNKRVFSLVTSIQDEVHRYAISFHHKKHSKRSLSSRFTEIDGIGEQKAKALIKHFKTVAAVKNASVEQLKEVKGISEKNAQKIYEYFNSEN
ncbi:MAG: excinuclease ABC subunit UvrC [Clostridiales bacterium]|nr:excinuclease ABC subunit UvrC [Clostridiales bacterium]